MCPTICAADHSFALGAARTLGHVGLAQHGHQLFGNPFEAPGLLLNGNVLTNSHALKAFHERLAGCA